MQLQFLGYQTLTNKQTNKQTNKPQPITWRNNRYTSTSNVFLAAECATGDLNNWIVVFGWRHQHDAQRRSLVQHGVTFHHYFDIICHLQANSTSCGFRNLTAAIYLFMTSEFWFCRGETELSKTQTGPDQTANTKQQTPNITTKSKSLKALLTHFDPWI